VSAGDIVALAYVVVGLLVAALAFHILTGGWDHLPERDAGQPGVDEAAGILDGFRAFREQHRGPFALVVAVLSLLLALLRPLAVGWYVVVIVAARVARSRARRGKSPDRPTDSA